MISAKGNALFLILIAVALFAALSYAVTQSGRGGGDIKREQNELAFTEIQNLISAYTTAMQRVVLTGTPLANVDARWGNWDHVNLNCTAAGQTTPSDCQIYHPLGGGLPLNAPRKNPASFGPAGAPYYSFNTDDDGVALRHVYNWFGTPTTGADAVLAMFTNRDFCVFFNAKNGITADPDTMTSSQGWNYWLSANWSNNSTAGGFGSAGNVPQWAGKSQGCMKSMPAGAYVILAQIWTQ